LDRELVDGARCLLLVVEYSTAWTVSFGDTMSTRRLNLAGVSLYSVGKAAELDIKEVGKRVASLPHFGRLRLAKSDAFIELLHTWLVSETQVHSLLKELSKTVTATTRYECPTP
jgi:hypothetical protein